MIVVPERLALLDSIHLDRAAHVSFEAGHCAMEVAAWLAGEPHSAAPACVALPLRRLTIGLNDAWPDDLRQELRPFLPRMVGTAGDGQDEARSYLALDWLVRTYTPAWLDLAGLAVTVRALQASALQLLDAMIDPGGATDDRA